MKEREKGRKEGYEREREIDRQIDRERAREHESAGDSRALHGTYSQGTERVPTKGGVPTIRVDSKKFSWKLWDAPQITYKTPKNHLHKPPTKRPRITYKKRSPTKPTQITYKTPKNHLQKKSPTKKNHPHNPQNHLQNPTYKTPKITYKPPPPKKKSPTKASKSKSPPKINLDGPIGANRFADSRESSDSRESFQIPELSPCLFANRASWG